MNRDRAVKSLAALAQDTRLEAFRQLVQAGPDGLAAGDLAERLGISPPALSFHLRGLAQAGLVRPRQQGRFIYYSAAFDAMQSLVDFLTENCCSGLSCAPARVLRRNPTRRTA
ncbi:MAG TPA: metalloregulator ArsR/SmtB family transcription factor [Steroidobacteraceae bacterium]|nr:metalloregulator ArsR/SmtB family transcription factor [Steroidobacteraceae bacterium]